MPNKRRCGRIVSIIAVFLTLARIKLKRAVTAATMLFLALCCVAQNQPQSASPASPTSSEASVTAQPSAVSIPAGTSFALVLTNPVASRTTHRGDQIHAQTTAPVVVGDQVLVPAGTFVQGTVDKLTRNGSRAEMQMKSASLVFADGYVANLAGPLSLQSDEGTAWRDPGDGARAGVVLAPLAGAGLGAAIGSAAHTTQSSTLGGMTITSSTPKGLMIGSVVGLAVGGVVALAILLHNRNFFVDVGSPMEMTLPQPLMLSLNQVADAVRWAQEHPVATPVPAPRPLPYPYYDRGTCYTPGSPGTPPTFIPGTPPIGDSPGTPGTFIPGTPATPGTPYPCP
jgi:hypothetical protein